MLTLITERLQNQHLDDIHNQRSSNIQLITAQGISFTGTNKTTAKSPDSSKKTWLSSHDGKKRCVNRHHAVSDNKNQTGSGYSNLCAQTFFCFHRRPIQTCVTCSSQTPSATPPKKKHCRSLSIPADTPLSTGSWKPEGSLLWKPIAVCPMVLHQKQHKAKPYSSSFNRDVRSSGAASSLGCMTPQDLGGLGCDFSTPPQSPIPRPASASSGYCDGSFSPIGAPWLEYSPSRSYRNESFKRRSLSMEDRISASTSSGSTSSVLASINSSPSSPYRHRIPRCRSQPCVLHDRKCGLKRRRDYDRPTLNFDKMAEVHEGMIANKEADRTRNRNLLKHLLKSLLFLIRKRWAARENYEDFLRFIGDHLEHPDLQHHFALMKKNATYLSKTTVDNFLKHIDSFLDDELTITLKSVSCLTLEADESTSESGNEMLSIYVKFMHPVTHNLEEKFLCQVKMGASKTAKALHQAITQVLQDKGIDCTKIFFVGLDTTNTMSGERGGLQRLLRHSHPMCKYQPCRSHKLALVLVHMMKSNPLLSEMDSLLIAVWKKFKFSTNNKAVLEETQAVEGSKPLKTAYPSDPIHHLTPPITRFSDHKAIPVISRPSRFREELNSAMSLVPIASSPLDTEISIKAMESPKSSPIKEMGRFSRLALSEDSGCSEVDEGEEGLEECPCSNLHSHALPEHTDLFPIADLDVEEIESH